MCGRFTVKATWAELVALYRLTMDAPPHNLRPRYNVCPTDPVDVVDRRGGQARVWSPCAGAWCPYWWSKPLKELRMATFNARAEMVEAKPFFRDAFTRTRCLIPSLGLLRMAGHSERKAALVFHCPRWITASHCRWALGRVEKSRDGRATEVLHDDHYRAQRFVAEIHDRMPVLLTKEQFAP